MQPQENYLHHHGIYILHKQLGGSTHNRSSQNDGTQAFDPSAWKGCFKHRQHNVENTKNPTQNQKQTKNKTNPSPQKKP